MECKNHKEVQASYVCTVCGEPLCTGCSTELNNAIYCRECLESIVTRTDRKPHKRLWWIALSLCIVPGTGHMYLGLIKKGLSLMTLLLSLVFATILFSEASGLYWMAGFLIPSFCFIFLSYSVFDCLSLTDRVNAGEDLKDEGIYELRLLGDLIVRRKGLFSLLLIFAGIIGLINLFSRLIMELSRQILGFSFPFTGLLFALLLIALGIYLLREGRR